jgi:FKBP-type peptidyl-prolyl cis-trans isomerase FkpA
MNKFKYFFILLIAGAALVSCNKNDDDDDITLEPLRDYQAQYNTDNANIEEYLKTNYITVIDSPGNQEDQDVTISKITDVATQPSIMSYLNSASFPKLLTRDVNLNGIAYKIYYLVLREGIGMSPMNTDGVLAAYKGEYMTRVEATTTAPIVPAHLKMTFFQEIKFPQSIFDLYGTIMGWSEIFPQFKTGKSSVKEDGTISYTDFGAGVMFLPSGLAYYSGGGPGGNIPSYSPLVFSVKLYDIQRLDHDQDGVLDINEDLNGDRYVRDYRNTTLYPNAPENLDDTDKDGVPDFLDIDDDGDGYTTILEITKPKAEVGGDFGPSSYYPFDAFKLLDDPMTPNIDESKNSELKGIPRKPTGLTNPDLPESPSNPKKFVDEDYTAAGRLRIHRDNSYPYKKN